MRQDRESSAVFSGVKAGLNMFRWVALGLFILFWCSGFTSIQPGEVGLVLRMGKLNGTGPGQQVRQPGLQLALPYPIDEVLRVPVKQEGQIVIDDFWQPLTEAAANNRIDPLKEGYCLTGDQYILQTKVVVKYRISDPIRFRLHVKDAEAILRDIVSTSLTQTIASWNIDDAWRRHRSLENGQQISLEQSVQQAANQRLQGVTIGLTIAALEFQEIHPPRHVRNEFADVQNALNEKQRDQDQAEGDAAASLLFGQAGRKRLEQEAVAEQQRLLALANAETSVVKELLGEYRSNPEFVRQRLRLEALAELQKKGVRQKVVPRGQPWRVIISDSEKAP